MTTEQLETIQELVMDRILHNFCNNVTEAMNEVGVEGLAPEELIDMIQDNILR